MNARQSATFLPNYSDVCLSAILYHKDAIGSRQELRLFPLALRAFCGVCATIPGMDVQDFSSVLARLRSGLLPIERGDSLVDEVEGEHSQARKAAVLLALFVQDGETHLAFIRRASTLRAHSGEIAFPGGSYESEDKSLVATALREAFEEIGLLPARVEVLGLLSPVFTVVSNFLIMPVVAYLPSGPGQLLIQASEVAEILLLPLQGLADPVIAHTEVWTRENQARTVYFYDYGPLRIWGATARILNNLLDLLHDTSG
ncbi:MAG TPA: CoA pyrophosphatase [Ktedonobacteraceae bacterium]|nr:CoA pyrophosphatase [Ktedonobacteraceae bacterium]